MNPTIFLHRRAPPASLLLVSAHTSMSRFGKPAAVAATVAVREGAHWITGRNITATGGVV